MTSIKLEYEVVRTLIVFPKSGEWHKELNLIKWNGREAKYDLRSWKDGRTVMGKGISLSSEEMKLLIENFNLQEEIV